MTTTQENLKKELRKLIESFVTTGYTYEQAVIMVGRMFRYKDNNGN